MRGGISAALLAVVAIAMPAMADITQTQTAMFDSDLNSDVILTFNTFNNQGGTLVLNNVRVDIRHEGGCILRADNDDDFKSSNTNGRIIRSWTVTGPDVFAFGTKTVNTNVVFLDVDNGDDGVFDPTAPDGTDFGSVSYAYEAAGSFLPNEAAYDTNGPGTIDFSADVLLMVNDLQFQGTPPDQWQLEVQDPYLHVEVTVVYEYSLVPVPAAAWLGALGLGVAGWIRRRVA